jgi:hypothetical protein
MKKEYNDICLLPRMLRKDVLPSVGQVMRGNALLFIH